MLYSLEVQTKYLSKLANIESLMDNSHYTNSEMRLLNKKNPSPTLKQIDKAENAQVIMDSFGKATQKLMEEEFNQSKYVTSQKTNSNTNEKKKAKFSIEIKSPGLFKFKRRSYLSEVISKEDMSDPVAFDYALKKIIHTHIEKVVSFLNIFSSFNKN